jgi:hypothetical protein
MPDFASVGFDFAAFGVMRTAMLGLIVMLQDVHDPDNDREHRSLQ